ncbi:unnamed protein product, partial [Ectocarpus sp. 8 AP-2014]
MGGGKAVTRKMQSSHTAARYLAQGQKCCQEHGCTT